ncbi:MAG TPA: thiamine pyrophosphate-dependent enzyme [Chloroflexota bacterium]|nr:thiamine pyrophosphate-dependent enzyme [Chloroflexota bacterium]
MRRYDLLRDLAGWVDEHMFGVTSLSSNTAIWSEMRPDGPNFMGLNMGLCVPFALGLSFAFPRRTVLALDSDGSLMNNTSALLSVGDLRPSNLVIVVMDNQSYARMGPTASSRNADLEAIARGAGIEHTATIRTPEEFEQHVKPALRQPGPSFFRVIVEAETERLTGNRRRVYGQVMKAHFTEVISEHPDYQRWNDRAAQAATRQAIADS